MKNPTTDPELITRIIDERISALAGKLAKLASDYACHPEFNQKPINLYLRTNTADWGQVVLAPHTPGEHWEHVGEIDIRQSPDNFLPEITDKLRQLPVVPNTIYEDDHELPFGALIETKFLGRVEVLPVHNTLPAWSIADWQSRDDVIAVHNGCHSYREYVAIAESIYEQKNKIEPEDYSMAC